jgi:hypothetical protein
LTRYIVDMAQLARAKRTITHKRRSCTGIRWAKTLLYICRNTNCLILALRAEWAKSKIRAHHWRVQLLLVCEEMRRSVVFVKWKATQWRGLPNNAKGERQLEEGKQAYASKHATAYEGLATMWAAKWQPLIQEAKTTEFKDDITDLGVHVPGASGVVIELEESEQEDDVDGSIMVSFCLSTTYLKCALKPALLTEA